MKWPVDINKYPITQKFGENPDMYKRFGLLGHNGIDMGCPTGTKILAPHSGKVIEATSDPTGYGLYIKIENDKEGSVLAHNQSFLVKVGDQVNEGQEIAISNNTGNSTGSHSHWGYYTLPRNRSNGYAGFIDQAPLLPARGDTSGGGSVTNYKGYDLDNKDSMKVAVDILVRVQAGEFVDKPKYDALEKEAVELRKRPSQCPPTGDPKADKLKAALKEFLS